MVENGFHSAFILVSKTLCTETVKLEGCWPDPVRIPMHKESILPNLDHPNLLRRFIFVKNLMIFPMILLSLLATELWKLPECQNIVLSQLTPRPNLPLFSYFFITKLFLPCSVSCNAYHHYKKQHLSESLTIVNLVIEVLFDLPTWIQHDITLLMWFVILCKYWLVRL